MKQIGLNQDPWTLRFFPIKQPFKLDTKYAGQAAASLI